MSVKLPRVALSAIAPVEREIESMGTRLAEMSRQVSEIQSHAERWFLSAPCDRYEKRVGTADTFFGPMDWDGIIAFAETAEQDWVCDPWNFYFMLQHLSTKFAPKLEMCQQARGNLSMAGASCIRDRYVVQLDNNS